MKLILCLTLLASLAQPAEMVTTTDGIFTVIESVAPLGVALTYVSGGNGLTGIADTWPLDCGGPAAAASAYDHCWLQFPERIIWKAPSATDSVFAIPGVDHDPIPYENLEFIIWGSDDGVTWEEGKIRAIYRDGFDTAATTVGKSDDYTSLWGFSKSYVYFSTEGGTHFEYRHSRSR